MQTENIHKKLETVFGKDYQRKDLHIVCKSILKEMGRSIKNPVEGVRKEWGAVCNFLNKWAGAQAQKEKPLLNREQELIMQGKVCPYCKRPSVYLKDSSTIFSKNFGPLYYCHVCRAWSGCHKYEPTKSKGRLANAELRELKKEAHAAFDPIWKSNLKSRYDAYTWLSEKLGIPRKYTHIGMFGVDTCKRVIELCKKELE